MGGFGQTEYTNPLAQNMQPHLSPKHFAVSLGRQQQFNLPVNPVALAENPVGEDLLGNVKMRDGLLRRPQLFWAVKASSMQWIKCHWQTGPASLVKVPLSENQPFTPMDGAP